MKVIAPGMLLVILLAGCQPWTPRVYHPGLANAGASMDNGKTFAFGMSFSDEGEPFARMEFKLAKGLTISGIGGSSGRGIGGMMGSLNWVVVDTDRFYLTLSPHIVQHHHETESEPLYSAYTLGLGITPGINLLEKNGTSRFRIYGSCIPGWYNSDPSVVEYGKGRVLYLGGGVDFAAEFIRVFLEARTPIQQEIGTTRLLASMVFGLVIQL
jgi:hypothetical protein